MYKPDITALLPFVGIFAAIIGAYCTTIDYRIRMKLPLVTKDCYCPSCGRRLSLFHQIPVLSWILLIGKCRYCKNPIPLRYPLIEAGFILYYCVFFLIFRNHFVICAAAWLIFLTLFLSARSQRHWAGLVRGLAIMYGYHFLFGPIIWAVCEASKIPPALP